MEYTLRKYNFVKAFDMTELANTIDQLLEQGWELQGGICAVKDKVTVGPCRGFEVMHYMQALYKETEEAVHA